MPAAIATNNDAGSARRRDLEKIPNRSGKDPE